MYYTCYYKGERSVNLCTEPVPAFQRYRLLKVQFYCFYTINIALFLLCFNIILEYLIIFKQAWGEGEWGRFKVCDVHVWHFFYTRLMFGIVHVFIHHFKAAIQPINYFFKIYLLIKLLIYWLLHWWLGGGEAVWQVCVPALGDHVG